MRQWKKIKKKDLQGKIKKSNRAEKLIQVY